MERVENSVLVVDPIASDRQQTVAILAQNGYDTYEADDPGHALEILIRESPPLIVTEIFFSQMNALQYLRALRRQMPEVVIIVLSAAEERRQGDDRRLGHLFEYLSKPCQAHELIGHLRRGFDYFAEKSSKLATDEEREKGRLVSQLEWLIWKEQTRAAHKINVGQAMIANIRNSISQGMGVGGLVTLIELMQIAVKPDPDQPQMSLLPTEMVRSLGKTADYVRHWLEHLEVITTSFTTDYKMESLECSELQAILDAAIERVESLRKIKGQSIEVGSIRFSFTLASNREVLSMVFEELLTNAMKYSYDSSSIHITCFRSSNSISLLLINDVQPMDGGITGIPEEFENEVFEPFCRLNGTYDERFHEESYGMGIGLTLAHHSLYLTGGKLYIYEIQDYVFQSGSKRRVVAEIILPLWADNRVSMGEGAAEA